MPHAPRAPALSAIERIARARDRLLQPVETGRICAVCGQATSPLGQKDTYGFRTILMRNGYPATADKAHRDCVSNLGK